jgi:methionyl-tRNA formyltransferase
MRAILLGSSSPGVAALETLLAAAVEIAGVGTHAGEEEGAVGESLHRRALELGLPTAQFERGRRAEIAAFAAACAPEVGFTVGFRFLLDAAALAVPVRGWLNVHSSLLPAYRGRAPVNWAILAGERELGATLHYLDHGVDTGDAVFQEEFPLGDDEDAGDAVRKLDGVYRNLIGRAVSGLRNGGLPRLRLPTDGEPWPRRTEEDGRIDWSLGRERVLRLVRAVAPPYPGAFTSLAGRRLYVLKAARIEGALEPGRIRGDGAIGTGDGAIVPLTLAWDGAGGPTASLDRYAGAFCGA